ncbi:right-handed parallel beta-helix repeat-containing protein, partial [Methanobrevibacter sp.]|uniref:right-handed parallel beta-helix repeat-containing protein n=1 Tax=Methanobrevibacter sp. TaxID=66852 RepID=UPI00388CEE2B
MKYSKNIIIIMLAIFLFAIATVSASDVDNGSLVSEDTDQMELSAGNEIINDNLQTNEPNIQLVQSDNGESLSAKNELDILGDDERTYTDLKNEIGNGGNINLTKSYYLYNPTSEAGTTTIEITTSGVIDGKGAVIDMTGSTIQAFYVTASGVTIKNLTIKNANYNGNGGGIYFSESGTVENCNFTDNHAEYGGAIYMDSGTVTNCNFTDNSASYGGAIYIGSGTVTNCNFTDNSASYGSAVLFWNEGTVSNCNFTDNSATSDGGAVFLRNKVTVKNCNFTNNSASGDGGAVYLLNNGEVTNCNFTNNSATGEYSWGGAIYMGSGSVENCNFADNSASEGGAISSMQSVTADTCIFKTNSDTTLNTYNLPPTLNVDNFTTFYGSGDKLTFDLKTNINSVPITNGNISISVYFKNNNSGVGNYSCLSGDGWIPDLSVGSYYVIFDTEYAEFRPINRTIKIIPNIPYYANVTSLTHNNRTVNITAESNIPNDILEGKLLFLLPNGDEIEANYSSNGTWWAEYTFDDYGVYLVNASYEELDNVTVNEGTITVTPEHTFCFLNYTINGNDNSVIWLSNDFYFDPNYDVAFVDGIVIDRPVTINGNGYTIDAKSQARIFQVNCNDVVLENITFINGNTTGSGSAVYFSESGRIINCNFTDNYASIEGGAVYIEDNGEVTNCNFTNNSAFGDGGAINMDSGTVSNCNFTDNSATSEGGAIWMYYGSVENCNFTNNTAPNYGGAIKFNGEGTVTNCNFTDNSAYDGGAIWMYSGSVENCNFTNNTASRDGGAVYSDNYGEVTNCNFIGNNATQWGGAIWFSSSGNIHEVKNCNFTNNSASSQGGAIKFSGIGTVTNCKFTNNTASEDGGAIWMSFGSVKNCNFTGNNATNGSAIYFFSTAATKTVSNSLFLNNRANAEELQVTKNDNNITITFTGNDNLLNAIYSRNDAEVTFTNVTYWSATGITNTGSSETKPSRSNKEAGQNITVIGVVNGNFINITKVTDENGEIILDEPGEYEVVVRHDEDSYYTRAEINLTAEIVPLKSDSVLSADDLVMAYRDGSAWAVSLTDADGNPIADAIVKVGILGKVYNRVTDADGVASLPINLISGTYAINATFEGDDDYEASFVNATVTVNKAAAVLTGYDLEMTYKDGSSWIVALSDADGNAITGVRVAIGVAGKVYNIKTDDDGNAVLPINLHSRTYTVNASFTDSRYEAELITATIVVNKA